MKKTFVLAWVLAAFVNGCAVAPHEEGEETPAPERDTPKPTGSAAETIPAVVSVSKTRSADLSCGYTSDPCGMGDADGRVFKLSPNRLVSMRARILAHAPERERTAVEVREFSILCGEKTCSILSEETTLGAGALSRNGWKVDVFVIYQDQTEIRFGADPGMQLESVRFGASLEWTELVIE